jgi:hypothetical protein
MLLIWNKDYKSAGALVNSGRFLSFEEGDTGIPNLRRQNWLTVATVIDLD